MHCNSPECTLDLTCDCQCPDCQHVIMLAAQEMNVKRPKWTVRYNIASPESLAWVGTGWEFFDTEEQASRAYDRHLAVGNVPTKRPYDPSDKPHLGAFHGSALDPARVEG